MTDEQLQAGNKLKEKQNKIRQELTIWERDLTAPDKLGYLQGWNNNHAAKLETNIPREIFDGFRAASMNALRLRLSEIETEFSKL